MHNSTFDAYIAALDAATPGAAAARASLPVVTKEIGDTWIYGLQADPIKATLLRELSRSLRGCEQSPDCDATSDVAKHFARALLKLTEHTFGYTWGFLNDHERWNNSQFEAALRLQNATGDKFREYEAGWIEQRSWADHAMAIATHAAAGDASGRWLEADAGKRVAAVVERGAAPNLAGFEPLILQSAMAGVVCKSVGSVQFNRSGALTLSRGDAAAGNATIIKGAGQYQYNTLDETDIHRFMQEYLLVQRDVAFGKQNVDNVAHPVSGHWLPEMVAAHAKVNATSGCEFWIELAMTPFLAEKYGAAQTLWSHFNLSAGASASKSKRKSATASNSASLDTAPDQHSQDGSQSSVRLEVEVRWLNKTATRLPEAHFVGYDTVPTSKQPTGSSSVSTLPRYGQGDVWLVDKLGQYVDVSPEASDVTRHYDS